MVKPVKLPLDTEIEVASIKGNDVVKRKMTYREALNITKIKGRQYFFYQIGFCQIKTKI